MYYRKSNNLHPIERENFDIEGYRDYCWRPENPSKFLKSRSMYYKLNDNKRTIGESTYSSNRKMNKSVAEASKMIEESKSTIRSNEPYIGGEFETGNRIHRHRNKARELEYQKNNYKNTKTVNRKSLLTVNHHNRSVISNDSKNKTLLNTSTMDMFNKSQVMDYDENISSNKKISNK